MLKSSSNNIKFFIHVFLRLDDVSLSFLVKDNETIRVHRIDLKEMKV